MDKRNFTAALHTHGALIGILVGAFLVSSSMGTYTNWDAQLEYEAATSVLTHGSPIVTTGLMINQPPLGFYLDAPVFGTLGLSYANGVGIATLFGLGCVALVYALGTLLYGKRTGLVAAALFGVVPWHAYISRIFLIDNQYLFFSLLCLIVGIMAIRQDSNKKLLAAGVLFALAFLTKLFAVFTLVPLLLIVYFQRNSKFKLTLKKALLFLAPTMVSQAIWFAGFANQNFWGVYFSSDFTHPVLIADPNPLFLPRMFVEGAGWFLLSAALLSLALTALFRKSLAGRRWFDLLCVGTIAAVALLDVLLVFGLHLTVPYISAFKYNYFTVPFLCLLAASVADKGRILLGAADQKRSRRFLKLMLVAAGLGLVLASLLWSVSFLNVWSGFVAFEVDSNGNYFPFDVYGHSATGDFFGVTLVSAAVLLTFSLAMPLLVWALRKPFTWLSTVLSS